MMCNDDFDISSGFRFSKISVECSVHFYSLYLPKPLPDHKFLHPHGFVKVVDAISQKIDGAFAPCAPL